MSTNFQEQIAQEFDRLIQPIVAAANDDDERDALFKAMGWDLESFDGNDLNDIMTVLSAINSAYGTFSTAIQTPPQTLADVTQLLSAIDQLLYAVKQLQGITGAGVMNGFSQLGKDLVEFLTTNYLSLYTPILFEVLVCLGLIVHRDEGLPTARSYHSTLGNRVRVPVQSHELRLDNIKPLLNSPETFLKSIYKIPASGNWQTDQDARDSGVLIFGRLIRLLNALGIQADSGYTAADGSNFGTTGNDIAEDSMVIRFSPDDAATVFGIVLSLSSAVRGDLGLLVSPFGATSLSYSFGSWDLTANLSTSVPGFSIGDYGFQFPTNITPDIGADLTVTKLPIDGTAVLVGSTTGTHLEIGSVKVGGNFKLTDTLREFGFFVELGSASFVIKPGDGDGFLQKVLPANGLQGEFDLKLMWDNVSGFHLEGSGSMEVKIPIHKTILDALTIDSMTVAAKIDQQIALTAAMSGTLKLGPFTAVFEEVGLAFDFDFPANKDGNLGALDVGLGFKPPSGLGLSLKEKTISGGGFLSFNKDEGRYVGALELSIKDTIDVKAVGILTTKLPNGQPGYSLLLLITVSGFQPIQLGFGFKLSGVGGLIGVNRRMNTDALRDGVRTKELDNILFPTDVVDNIDSIVSTLEKAFPIAEGRYTFGPMAIIEWGTPTLITAELGIFFELPDPEELAIIGVIRALLPSKDKALLKLQIAFAGIINFEKKYITFDATLFDSTIVGMPLSGDMVFRLRWGDQPAFALSVGGFHPKFPIPAALNIPPMNRLTVNLLSGNNPRLTLSSYFAVTSNTAQFGSAIDFYWGIGSYFIIGDIDIVGHLGFDALFYFSPFRFTASIDASLDLRRNGSSVFAVWLYGTLEGPSPWHVQGNAGFTVCGHDFQKDFNRTFGQPEYTALPDVEVLPKLITALQDRKNWQATLLNTNKPLLVTMREINTPGSEVVLHPQGTLAVSQKVVPLNTQIARFGNSRPSGYSYFTVDIALNGGSILPKTELREFFAPNEFFDLSESDRLNRPSFEQLPSGAQITSTSDALSTGGKRLMQYSYETIVMDSRRAPKRYPKNRTVEDQTAQAFATGNAAAKSVLGRRATITSDDAPGKVQSTGTTYAIAQTSDLTQLTGTVSVKTQTEAIALMEQQLELNPALEGKIQIVKSFELAP